MTKDRLCKLSEHLGSSWMMNVTCRYVWRERCSGDCWKQEVKRPEVTRCARAFHSRAPATGNARSLTTDHQTVGYRIVWHLGS